MNQAALLESFLLAQRKAVDALIDFFAAKDFNDPSLALNVKVLAELSHHHEGTILGNALHYAERAKTGAFDALDTMEQYIGAGMNAHKQAMGSRHQMAGLMHLPPVLAAIQVTAKTLPPQNNWSSAPVVQRIVLVISNLSYGAATTLVAQKIFHSLRQDGLDVYVLRTGHARSASDSPLGSNDDAPRMRDALGKSVLERSRSMVQMVSELEPDAIIYYTWPTDIAAQVVSCLRMSPRQVFINHTCDQKVGVFDARVCYTQETAGLTDPLRCVYFHPVRVREESYEDITQASILRWGLDNDTVVIGNYSRLSKCVDTLFLAAMAKILHKNPSVVLMLPGLPDPDSEAQLTAWFASEGLLAQVRFPGFLGEDYLPLLKATRIYCDTFTWTGGQSVLDAMAMGVPVVASEPVKGHSALDPSGVSPASLASTLLPDTTLVAPSANVDAYVATVQHLLDSPEFHVHQSQRAIERSRELAWAQYPKALVQLLQSIALPAEGSAEPRTHY